MSKKSSDERIGVVGAGSIGVAWSVVFATAGSKVALYDPDPGRLEIAREEFTAICSELLERELVTVTVDEALALLTTYSDLPSALQGATYVQECAPERLALKRELFSQIAQCTGEDTIIASSSSAIPVSSMVEGLSCGQRSVVVHPLNPPYLLRVAEIVPSSQTSADCLERATLLMEQVGIEPLAINAEVEGFLFNRLQGALLREAYCLVRDGVASVEQIAKAISRGLGGRWSVLGVFETVDLNTRGGIESHAEKLGPAYARMGAERGQHDPWTKDLVSKVAGARRAVLPIEKWDERVLWRNSRLMDLARLRKDPEWQ